MAICIDPPIQIGPYIDGINELAYVRPFASIEEVTNWEFNNRDISLTTTYKVGYRMGKSTDTDIESLVRELVKKAPKLSVKSYQLYRYGLMNGRTVRNLHKHPVELA